MKTKLTVRVDRELVEIGKRFARQHGTSLSRLVENYLRSLSFTHEDEGYNTPVLQRLTGILPPDVSLEDHHHNIEEKYG